MQGVYKGISVKLQSLSTRCQGQLEVSSCFWAPAKSSKREAKTNLQAGLDKPASRFQMSKGNPHLSDSDWGEFLLTFELGLLSLLSFHFLISTPPLWKVFECARGGSADSDEVIQGPLYQGSSLSLAPCSNKARQRPRQDKEGQDKSKQLGKYSSTQQTR